MKNLKTSRKISSAAMLAIVAGSVHVHAGRASAQGLGSDPLDTFDFYGVLRDFSSDHPDFGLAAGDANGHFAGNISFFADGDFKPVYVAGGAEIQTHWKDRNGNPIAPHLFNFSGYNAWPEGTLAYSTGSISMGQGGVIDSWNSDLGDYTATQGSDALIGIQSIDASTIDLNQDGTIMGSVLVGPSGDPATVIDDSGSVGGGITGATGNLAVAPDPLKVQVPDFGESMGDVSLSTSTTLNKSIEVDKFNLGDGAILRIEGDVEIVCHDRMTIGQGSEIQLGAGATLKIYSLADVQAVSQKAMVNVNTMDPRRVTFFHLSGLDFRVSQYTEVYATVYAPGAQVYISQDADIYGRVLADRIDIGQDGALHVDQALMVPDDACGITVADTPGAFSAAHDGAISSDRTFRQWFRTLPTVNASKLDYVTLKNNGGIYEFSTADMTIADGDLLGDEGQPHNRNYTMEFGAVAQYDKCQGQFFEFAGDGDAWLMINDKLVIDLGGLGKGKHQFADLDRLGLWDGELYVLRFFYAQRSNDSSGFAVRTNANLLYSRGVIPESSGLFD